MALGGLRLLAPRSTLTFDTMPVERGNIRATVGSTGNIHARQTAVLAWKTSGTVAGLNVQPGDVVQTGQLLASLDPNSLPGDLLQAKIQLVSAQNALKELQQTDTARAKAWDDLLQARKALNDARAVTGLLDQPNASPTNLEAAQAAYNLALSQVDTAEQMYSLVQGRPLDDPARLQAAAQVSRAYRQRDLAQINLQYAQNKPNEQAVKQVSAEVSVAEASLEEAQRAWERVKDGPDADEIHAAELRVESLEMSLARASLNAPISGTVTEVLTKPGDVVAIGTQAMRIDDFSQRHVIVQVPEIDIVRVRMGQAATLTIDALGGRLYHGEVITVSRVGKQSLGNIEFEVEVRIIDGDDSVQPGMTAAVSVVVEERTNVVLIPNRAVRRLNGQTVVYLLSEGAATPVNVTLGLSDETNSELLAGAVQPGDPVILDPPSSATQSINRASP